MATENNGVAETPVDEVATTATEETSAADIKGKGKAVASAEDTGKDVAMDEDDDDEEDEDEVSSAQLLAPPPPSCYLSSEVTLY